ncbi:LysR family transcriptional regulator [Pandoraea sp. ISTKB]|uniref:LysR family transcriptional regulator n=1 Tax=Pandoraea sp. ISTKB TaxID=1586708 RepID=UPI000846703A|nr:LysR family transcriptional regulator [Pandoraea sp. ISTKB]ODP31728.1 LysR family transcriptional regulator [Pandoraea sp. ISTKB]
MNLHHLTHFLAVAETGSFSRASEVVHLTQPALSRSIQMLEQELGVKLFDRIGKRNELTPFGIALVEKARKITAESADLKRTIKLLSAGDGGVIRVGMGYAPNAMFAGPLLSWVLTHYPGVTLHLSTGSPEAQLALLRERVLDGLLVHSRAIRPHDDLEISLVGSMQSGFMCKRGHPLAKRRNVAFDDIVKYPVVSTMLSDEVARTLVQQYGPTAHADRILRATSDSIAALIEAVQNTDAVFFGAMGAARSLLENGSWRQLKLTPTLDVHAPYAFVTLTDRTQSPMLDKVRAFCIQLVAQKIKTGGAT